ncbi:XrtY-associated glycosyltransferase XYAG1 [Pedobacter sp. Leaf176]|uniref:XrtY-associated glycosyltransferase XYAG1 n=1 Tax=Pedobacter sp. Leaf176 TaxID=1736286 RepID=UPI0006F37450|nr:glycosyltransferase [Pedobacter sp. Leaf176]KQR72683.1 hypothetical protein ASF92_05260 [Pedobacter sp. Leaf176]
MKIIHITASYIPAYLYGGPIQSVGKLCEVLSTITFRDAAKKQQIEVLTTTANGTGELHVASGKRQFVNGVSVYYFRRWTKDHSHFSPLLLNRLNTIMLQRLKGEKLVIHIHAWWNLVSVLSCWIAKWHQIPVVLSPRGMLSVYSQNNRHSIAKTAIHKLVGKRLLQYCHIHATSEQEQKEILKIVQPKSITVIPNLLNMKHTVPGNKYREIHTKFQEPHENLRLIFLSRIEEKKGLDLLFDALALVNISWSLTLAGTGDKNYVESLGKKAKALKINERIKWLGLVTDEDKFELMANHDLCVLTSYNENFANVVIESLSTGTAVLVSDKVGLSQYVRNSGFGWLTKLNVKEISQQLIAISGDKKKLSWIRANAPQVIRQDFDDQNLVSKYIDLYRNVIIKSTNEHKRNE